MGVILFVLGSWLISVFCAAGLLLVGFSFLDALIGMIGIATGINLMFLGYCYMTS